MTILTKFLSKSENTKIRESIINNKLFFDLKVAAARAQNCLNLYIPEIDKDGFDVIFDDNNTFVKVQLKTVMVDATTKTWKIHKRILRPQFNNSFALNFEVSPEGIGDQGAVILIEINGNSHNELTVAYYYTDILILCAMRDGFIPIQNKNQKKAIDNFFSNIIKGLSTEKISLSKNLFIGAKNPESLLALMGLRNPLNLGWYRHMLIQMTTIFDENEKIALKCEIESELQKLSRVM